MLQVSCGAGSRPVLYPTSKIKDYAVQTACHLKLLWLARVQANTFDMTSFEQHGQPSEGHCNWSSVLAADEESVFWSQTCFGCLRMEKVGWIFTQSSKERDYIMNSEEISQMAAWQDEVGEHCVTGVVSLAVSDEGSDVHFEAFQVRICTKRMQIKENKNSAMT